MPFAQLVIGPPGSGKSTYCDGMQQLMSAIGRKCSVVNLDPANDHVSYPAAIDTRELVPLEEIMESEELGPNGGILYGLEELENNLEWFKTRLKELGDDYVIFDCPGQVELFTHHSSLRNIFLALQKMNYRMVVVHLLDSFVLTKASLYISGLLLSLRSMLQMELPAVNVLTKIDNLRNFDRLPFNLDFYVEAQGLDYLTPHLEAEQPQFGGTSPFEERVMSDSSDGAHKSKFSGLNKALIELITDFGLVGFETLAVEDQKSMVAVLRAIDRAGGYAFGGSEGVNETVWGLSMTDPSITMDIRDVQERWIDRRDELDELERAEWAKETADSQPPDALPNEGFSRDNFSQDNGIRITRKDG